MTTTTNLALTLIESGQSQKEVTANEAFADLDSALCETTSIAMDDGTNTITAAQARGAQRIALISGSETAAFTAELPAIKRLLVVTNNTSYDATIVCADAETGASEVDVPAGATRVVYCDATEVIGMSVDAAAATPLQCIPIACSDETTDLTTGDAKVTFRMPFAFTLTSVRASVTTAPTGAAISIDIKEGATTVLSTALTIDAGEKTSTTATPAVISDAHLADDAEITIDIDAVGSTIAGAGLKVYLIGRPA